MIAKLLLILLLLGLLLPAILLTSALLALPEFLLDNGFSEKELTVWDTPHL